MNKVKLLLYQIGLGHRAARFDELEIDNVETLEALSEDDLREVMGGDERELRILQLGMAKDGLKGTFSTGGAASGDHTDPGLTSGSSALPSPNASGDAGARSVSPIGGGGNGGAANPSARLSPTMVRYNQLLRKRGVLLKNGASERDMQWLERELEQVKRELGFDGDADAVTLTRGDKVRIVTYNGCSKELLDLAGKVAVVVEPPPEAYHAVKVRLVQTNEMMMLPAHCLRHMAESKFAKSRVRPAWGTGDTKQPNARYTANRPDMVRRAVQKERAKRADPFTVHGHRTHIDTSVGRARAGPGGGGGGASDVTLHISCVLRPEISHEHLMSLLASRLWADRGVYASSVTYARATHTLTWDMSHDTRSEVWLSSEIDPFCNTRSVTRQNPAASPRAMPTGVWTPNATTASASATPAAMSDTTASAQTPTRPMDAASSYTHTPTAQPPTSPASAHAQTFPPHQQARGGNGVGKGAKRGGAAASGPRRAQRPPEPSPATPDTAGMSTATPNTASSGHKGGRGGAAFLNADNLRARAGGRAADSPAAGGYAPSMASESPSDAQFTTYSTAKKGAALEDELRLKLSQAATRIRVFQNEIANYKLREKKLTRKLEQTQKAADRRDKETTMMREKNTELVTELHKLSRALDTIMGTLSESGSQWAEHLLACGDQTAARMSRGVISEVLATNHEISEKLRHINHIVRIAEADTASVSSTQQGVKKK